MPEKYYARGESKSNYETMTKEEILAAIIQAVEHGTVQDIDAGFITKIKELNKGYNLRFWVGTTAEFNALGTTESNVLYIKTDDTTPEDINAALTAQAEKNAEQDEQLASHTSELAGIETDLAEIQLTRWIPEHGILATDDTITTPQAVRAETGFGVWSLYGELVVGTDSVIKFWRLDDRYS